MRLAFSLIAAVAASLPLTLQAGDWPAFRGPQSNGMSDERNVPVEWNAEKNVRWKVALPEKGNSSPIVVSGRVFIAVATDEGRKRHLLCFDRKDGRELWRRTVEFDEVSSIHKTNDHAPATPVSDGQRVVAWFGPAGLHAWDLDGKPLWSQKLGPAAHEWGYAASPILWRDRVLLNYGPGSETGVAALSLETGDLLWKTPEDIAGNGEKREDGKYVGTWSTPLVVNVDGRDQVLVSMPTRVVAYDPETGSILWHCDGLRGERGDLVYTSIVVGEGIGCAMGGFKGPAIGFRVGGTGDITETGRLWRVPEAAQRIGSGVMIGRHLFIANAGPGTVQCIDAETGHIRWESRLPGGQGGNHWGSLVFVDGRLYVTNQDGVTHVFAPNPEQFEIIASNPIGEPSNATPAFSDGEIFLRTFGHLYCIAQTK